MNSDCFVFVEERDEFRMWQGLVGPHYTPAVDSLGNLSWTNNGNLVNPPTVNVSGRGLTITGIVDTAGDLPASAPQYTCYLVGITAPYHAYIFDGTSWTDIGIVGKGDTGADGFSPIVTVTTITGGHEVSIEDANGTQTFDVIDGAPGQGVPSGGTTGQVLAKASGTDYDTAWVTRANIVNPNLLDNWYFVGGGSQLGYGVFPVNQRGQGTYMLSSNSYGMDRWASFEVGSKHTLNSYGVLVETNGTNYAQIAQRVSNFPQGTITISFLTGNVAPTNPVRIYLKFSDGTNDYYDCSGVGQNDLGYHTFTVGKTVTQIRFYTNASGSKFSVQAVKAEPGGTQTLAHQENGAWVLNEMPDYAEELANCKLYFERISAQYAHIGSGFCNNATTAYIWGACSPKRSMVFTAGVSFSGTMYVWSKGKPGPNGTQCTTMTDGFCSPNGEYHFAFTGSGFTAGEPCGAQIRDTSTYIDISAE